MDRFITKTGFYQNLDKRRLEYWLVISEENKVLVSWVCWSAPQTMVEQWKGSYAS
ncbi:MULTISPECIES: hypothetical protein [Bacillales]|uniref:hypothetical protein n=1 Tax=Bacillales TaxID=1385 RepID=UPI0018845554|nr:MULTISPECIES: hypothetical protein [Bacillaceae]MBF0708955.1 hypothetical protein [Pseudalkalibacillus hwajinpoensis]MDO6655432.1 hypothetical protein [Anaerobacillus sp. 1_MG-2023]WLR60233.1 hypothetical protein LC071_02315 [Pseudalkalibacillus hwajinpoensis]